MLDIEAMLAVGVTVRSKSGWDCTYFMLPGGGYAVGCRPSGISPAEIRELNEVKTDRERRARETCQQRGHAAVDADDGTLLCMRCGDTVPLEDEA